MFLPEGGKPVPLKLATWNWSGTAYYVPGNPDGFARCGDVVIPQAAVGVDCLITTNRAVAERFMQR